MKGSETLTVKEIVTQIHVKFGKQVPENCFGSIQRKDVSMKYLALNGEKLEKAIGFKSSVRIIDIIEKYS